MKSIKLAGALALAIIAAVAIAAAFDPAAYALLAAAISDPHFQSGVAIANVATIDTEVVKAELGKITERMNNWMEKRKEKEIELQARLLEVEQKGARRGSGPGGDPGTQEGHSLGEAADAIIAGMKDATSARTSLAFGVRSLAVKAALSGTTYPVPPESIGPVSVYHPAIARLIDLLPARPTTSNSIVYVRVKYATNSPPDGNMAAKVAELAPKPQSNVDTEPVSVEMATYAHWTESSKQILDDVAELRAILDGILRGGLLDVVDADIYDVLTTGGNYTAFSPVGAVIGDNVARIAAQIANVGGSNIIVGLNPLDYLTMQLAKASTAGSYLGIPPNLASRVVSVAAVAQSKILAFAPFSGASWADREGVNVVAGLRNDQFTRNALTLLAECRGATLVRDPAHVAYGNVTA